MRTGLQGSNPVEIGDLNLVRHAVLEGNRWHSLTHVFAHRHCGIPRERVYDGFTRDWSQLSCLAWWPRPCSKARDRQLFTIHPRYAKMRQSDDRVQALLSCAEVTFGASAYVMVGVHSTIQAMVPTFSVLDERDELW